MSRERRIELAWVAASVLVAGVIALLAKPLPPLVRHLGSHAWARGAEFVVLVMVLWMLMGAIGLIRVSIDVGLDGMRAKRLSDATKESREMVEGIQRGLRQLQETIGQMATRLDAVTSGLLADHGERIRALEQQSRTLASPPDDGLQKDDSGV